MISREFVFVNCKDCRHCASRFGFEGMHAGPSALTVRIIEQYASAVHFTFRGYRVDARSILDLLMLQLWPGQLFKVEVDGPDEVMAIEGIARHLLYGIDEPLCPDFKEFAERWQESHGEDIEAANPLDVMAEYSEDLEFRGSCIHGRSCRGEDSNGF